MDVNLNFRPSKVAMGGYVHSVAWRLAMRNSKIVSWLPIAGRLSAVAVRVAPSPSCGGWLGSRRRIICRWWSGWPLPLLGWRGVALAHLLAQLRILLLRHALHLLQGIGRHVYLDCLIGL